MRTDSNQWPALLSLLMIAIMGASILTLLPLWVGALTDQGLFSQSQIGWLAAADVMGIFAATASGIFWVRKLPWKTLAITGLCVFFIANLLSLGIENFALLMATRILAGLGCGTAYAIALAGLGDHKRPDFAFGLMVTAQVGFGTIGFFVMPKFIQHFSVDGFFHYLNIWLVITLIASAIATPSSQKNIPEADMKSLWRIFNFNALLVFSAVVIYYCGVSAVWAYLERMGVALGLSAAEVGDLLGTGFAISGAGSLVAPLLAQKLGKSLAFSVAVIVQVIAMALLFDSPNSLSAFSLYACTTIAFQFFWSFAVPLLMDQFNQVDATGRLIVLCASAFKIGEMAGPPVAAQFIHGDNYTGVLSLGIGAIVLAMGLVIYIEARTKAQRLILS